MSPVINLDGTHTIQNMAWEARYADLSDNQANGLIIGFEFNNRSNQKVVMLFILIFLIFSLPSASGLSNTLATQATVIALAL